jgi:serine protease AprX
MKRVVTAILTLGLLASIAYSKPPKLSPDLANTSSAQTQVIIQWTSPIGAETAALLSLAGGTVVSEFTSVNQGVYMIPSASLPLISDSPLVRYASPTRPIHKKLAFAAAAINAPAVWKSGYNGTGVGVAILDSGINQSDNLGLTSNTIAYVQDFTVSLSPVILKSDLTVTSYGQDWYGHGQHIAGIIASNGKASTCGSCNMTMTGIAPGAKLIDLKVLDEFGNGSDAAVIAAINQAIALKNVYNIRVINLSLGRPIFESYTQDPLCQAVEAAWKAGITVVVAAGNDGRNNSNGTQGYGTINAPGNDPYVITVGAMKTEGTFTRTDDLVGSYSSKGPTFLDHVVKPDIVAPGNLIVSLLATNGTLPLTTTQNSVPLSSYQTTAPPTGRVPVQKSVPSDPNIKPPGVNFGGGRSNQYFTLSGTSMAAGVVSGAVADLLHAYPKLTPDQVKMLLMTTAYKTFPTSSTVFDPASGTQYVSYYDAFTVGAGYLDLQAALAAAQQVQTTGTALSPIATLDSTGNLLFNFDPTSLWTDATLYGSKGVWSTASDSATKGVWSTSADSASKGVWSASSDSANKGVWSTKSVWSTSGVSSTSSMDTAESVAITGEP